MKDFFQRCCFFGYVIVLLVTVFTYSACTNDGPTGEVLSRELEQSAITNELKSAYALRYKETTARSESMSDSIFGFSGLEPQWELSRTLRLGDSIELTEVPLNAKEVILPISESLLSLDMDEYSEKSSYVFLVRKRYLKDPQKSLNYFMNVMPDVTMLQSQENMTHRAGLLPTNFRGEVLFFDLDGTIKRKHNYWNGKLIHDYIPTFSGSNLRSMTGVTCISTLTRIDYYYYGEVGGESSEHTYSHSSYRYQVRCFMSVLIHVECDASAGGFGGGGYKSSDEDAPKVNHEKRKNINNVLKDELIIKAIHGMWQQIKESTSRNGRMEKGFYVFYDYKTGKYFIGNMRSGSLVRGGEGTNGTVQPGSGAPSSNGAHIPKEAEPICFIHGHTPLTYADKDAYRKVGLSLADQEWADKNGIPIVAHDYVGKYDSEVDAVIIIGGHDKNDPTKNYIAIPKKR